jgi:hypothetical protein
VIKHRTFAPLQGVGRVAEHVVGVAEALHHRDDLHPAAPALVGQFGDLFPAEGERGGDLRVPAEGEDRLQLEEEGVDPVVGQPVDALHERLVGEAVVRQERLTRW